MIIVSHPSISLDLGTPTRTLIALLPSKSERGETTLHERKQIPARLLWYHEKIKRTMIY